MQTRLPFDDRPKPRHTGVTRPRFALHVFRGPDGAFIPEARETCRGRERRKSHLSRAESIALRWWWRGEAANDTRKGPRMLPSGYRSWADLDRYYADLAAGLLGDREPSNPEP